MLDLLPALPDQATLAAMRWWAVAGAAIGLGAWIFNRIAERNVRFGQEDRWNPPEVEVPGAEPADQGPDWTSPRSALTLAVLGTLGGALMGWPMGAPIEEGAKFELVGAAFGLFFALVVLTRLLRSGPAVGEAPPEDPETTVAARLPGAAWEVAFAVAMLAAAWFALS